ncbi:hypothetical protein WG66_005725 [Moniliophthora roreri]|nr:hypothetical protein WG66_005725 [Moniliophthora roreri]
MFPNATLSHTHIYSRRVPLAELTRDLNSLLYRISLPLTLTSPTELTPTLILAILESILEQRLPLDHEIRRCRTEDAKVICMKMVLGVLQTDVLVQLGADPGGYLTTLSVVDPGRLANGDLGEVERVASALCWVGERFSLVTQRSSSASTRKSRSITSSSQSPPHRRAVTESDTSVQNLSMRSDLGLPHLSSFDSPGSSSTISASNKPRCIHEVSSPSEEYETGQFRHRHPDPHYSSRDTSAESILAPVSLPPVRESGYIEEVDEDEEIRSFERSQDSIMIPFLTTHDSEGRFSVPEGASHVRTVELLKERAQLLYRIAKLQQQDYQFG